MADCGEPRKYARSAISCGSTKRGIDCALAYCASTSASLTPRVFASAAITRVIRSPRTEPGQMAFARTP